jgi:hypothetical protein
MTLHLFDSFFTMAVQSSNLSKSYFKHKSLVHMKISLNYCYHQNYINVLGLISQIIGIETLRLTIFTSSLVESIRILLSIVIYFNERYGKWL